MTNGTGNDGTGYDKIGPVMRTIRPFSRILRPLAGMLLFAGCLGAQRPDFKAPAQAAVGQLAAMVGEWKGSGWVMQPGGTRHTTHVHEQVQWKLDQTVLQVEGRGVGDDGHVAHDALGLIYFDNRDAVLKMTSHLAFGMHALAVIEVIEPNKQLRWELETMGGRLRYTITFKDDGNTWHETGEFTRDGTNWYPTLEMTLTKVNTDGAP